MNRTGRTSVLWSASVLCAWPTLSAAETLRVPSAYPTIIAAMGAAIYGDTVLVACGVYHEYDIHVKDGVTLRSEGGAPDCVRIDGGFAGTVLLCEDLGQDTLLEGITVTGGHGLDADPNYLGGGLHCRNASPRVRRCGFKGNLAVRGAGVLCESSSAPEFEQCEFAENGASWIMPSYYGGGAACWRSSSARFVECEFRGNWSWFGGGLYIHESAVEVRDCAFIENFVHPWQETGPPGSGGGLCCFFSTARIERCTFTRNTAEDWLFGQGVGGGMACIGRGGPIVKDCEFIENGAFERGGGCAVGVNSEAYLSGCRFRGNWAFDGGGALSIQSASPVVAGCVFDANLAHAGSAVFCRSDFAPAAPIIRGCSLLRNGPFPWDGGGNALECAAASPSLANCTFARNAGGECSGIRATEGSTVTISRCILAFGKEGAAIVCEGPPSSSTVTLSCSDIYGNEGGDWVDCVAEQPGANGNFSADPIFCDLETGDLGLSSESPCLPGQHPDGYDCDLIGAQGVRCTGPTLTMPSTWGALKSRFAD